MKLVDCVTPVFRLVSKKLYIKTMPLAIIFVTTFQISHAQYGGCLSVEKLTDDLKKTVTLVAITGNEEFDENFKKGMEEFWELTEYEFQPIEEVRKRISDNSVSIIMPTKISITDNVSTQTYPLLAFFLGGEKSLGSYGYERLLAYAPIDNFGREKKVEYAAFRAKHIPSFFQQYIELRTSGKLDVSCSRMRLNAVDIYRGRSGKMSGKTMLIDKALLEKVNEGDIAKSFTSDYKIVTKEQLAQSINEGTENTCYLMPVFTRHKYVFVVDCVTGEIMYNTYDTYGMVLKKKDIKGLAIAAGK